MRCWLTCVVWGCLGVGLAAPSGVTNRAGAAEPHLEFLHALRDAGYGELAMDYVEQLRKREGLPLALREVLDLEMAHSLLTAAEETEHRNEAEQRLAAAKGMLDKFLKEHSEHPAAPEAFAALADMESKRGQTLLRQARIAKDAAAKAPLLAEARNAFESARPRYDTAVDRYAKRFQRMEFAQKQAGNKRPNKREQEALLAAELDWLELRGQQALVDYHIAQTFADPNDPARKAALQKAGTALDEIYQRERLKQEGLTSTGLYAHMWHGKVMDELGDLTAALDIYDEVLANAPAPTDRRAVAPALVSLFAQVEYFRLLILIKKKDQDQFIAEAQEWLETNRKSEKTMGFQGISLELAKAYGAKAEAATPEAARKLRREANSLLVRMSEVPGEFQQDALVLRRLLLGNQDAEIKNFSEATALATAAVESDQLNEAAGYYTKAIELAAKEDKLDPEEVIKTRFRLANVLWATGKLTEAGQTAEAIMNDASASPTAPAAAAMAINAAKAKYFSETTPDAKAAALEHLGKVSDETIKKWPDRAEADDARIALGQASMVRGDLTPALNAFQTVKEASDRYPQALQQAGQVLWQLYLIENRKPASSRDANQLTAYRTQAEQSLQQSRTLQRQKLKAGEPLPQTLTDAELLLAEVCLESSKPEEAAALLEPLLEASKAAGGALDRTKLRLYVAAVRAYVATKAFDKAAGVASVLIQSGDDSPVINHVLVDFAKLINAEYKRVQADSMAAESGADPAAAEKLKTLATDLQNLYSNVLQQLATRRNHSLANLIYLGESCADNNLTDKARELFGTVLTKAAEEKGSVPQQAEIRIRAKLIGLLRNEKKYNEALPEVEKLIAATGGRALEPLVEKGNLLQSRAESSPYDARLYDEAVAHWTSLRVRMQNMNPKPPEYYQLIYNTAHCVMMQAEQTRDKAKALQVVQILNSVLQLNRNALTPDMATRYDALVAKARKVQ